MLKTNPTKILYTKSFAQAYAFIRIRTLMLMKEGMRVMEPQKGFTS
jgi:hypothetical protein